MIGRAARVLALMAVAGAFVPAMALIMPGTVQAALSTGEQAAFNVVVAAEGQADPAAQVAAIMSSSLSGPQKALALQWLVEGAATDAQVAAIAAAIVAAVIEAGAAGQSGAVAILGTGLGQAYQALNGDGRASAAGAVMSAMQGATAEPGAAGGLSRQMSQVFTSAFTEAAAGTPRGAADSSGEDAPEQGQTNNPVEPTSPSPS